MPPRYVCIHGHFYQPPRENPWLEAIEVQDSASPYHDWNERITRECYGPNSRARLVDQHGRIIDLINNYAWMSFNFGPTLLEWMEKGAPDVLHGLIEGDRLSRARRGGHGNALAQVYNHVIMPLAGPRDQRIQVAWGLADFRRRFGRDPEGMWLPETAVDLPSLEVLADAGIRFTILAPRQARRWRRIGEDKWLDQPDAIDPSRAYRCQLPSGKSIALFFYDGNLSRQVAFEGILSRGEKLLSRILQAFSDDRSHPQIVHLATDGESYGHHHAHGDMALAYVLSQVNRRNDVRLTNYGEFLELHPPEWEVEIHENSSWSCVHGLERWRSDCGCRMNHAWHQHWRSPLREAFNVLKAKLDTVFEMAGRKYFSNPWQALAEYVDVFQDRRSEKAAAYLGRQAPRPLSEPESHEAFRLLEMQRNGQLMFTSCGWFFDDLSGLEATQCLRYAARGMQHAQYFGLEPEEEIVRHLEKAPSNIPRFKNGRGVWEQMIRPSRVDLGRVLAHYAISLMYHPPEKHTFVYRYEVEALDQEVRERGETHVAVGRLKVYSQLTNNTDETCFVVLHLGGLDFRAILRVGVTDADYAVFKAQLFASFENQEPEKLFAWLRQEFPGDIHRLDDLFLEEKRRIIGIVLQDRFLEYQKEFDKLAEPDNALLEALGRLNYPIPRSLRIAAATSMDQRLAQAVEKLKANGSVSHLKALLESGKAWGYEPENREALAKRLESDLRHLIGSIDAQSDLPLLTARVDHLLDAAKLLGVSLDLWQTQNHLLNVYAQQAAHQPPHEKLKQAFDHLAERLNIHPHLLGWRP